MNEMPKISDFFLGGAGVLCISKIHEIREINGIFSHVSQSKLLKGCCIGDYIMGVLSV